MPLICTGKSDIGKVRKSNQDSIYINPNHKCFIVADGMGGHRGGDIASQLTTKIFGEHFNSVQGSIKNKIKDVLKCIKMANTKIMEKSQTEPLLKGMGTTAVSMCIEGNKAYIANIGDSRTYLISEGKLYQLTKDHSLVQEKINLGIISRDEASRDRMKNVLVRTIGFEEDMQIDSFEYSISKNDMFLLCSDGLYSKVYDKEMIEMINQYIPDPSKTTPQILDNLVQALIDRANHHGGNDNISIIMTVAQVQED